jgi:hypothetical protein
MSELRMNPLLLLVALVCLSGSLAGQVSPQTFGSAGRRAPNSGMFALSSFYEIADPLPAGKPGDLIRFDTFDRYELPFNIIAVRILYYSLAAQGTEAAASGVVLYPDGNPPPGGWPVIAWAHPVTGVARTCAPSLMKNLYDGPVLSMYVNMGYAVVATDYVGLGTSFRSAFIDAPSNATDVIYAVSAARRAVPQLGTKWVAIGEEDGGAAVLMVAEMESEMGDVGYLGSIAISGAMVLRAELEQLHGEWHDNLAALAYGIQSVYPEFRVQDMLTTKAMETYREISQKCSVPTSLAGASSKTMLRPKWEANPYVQKFVQRNTLAEKPARATLLLIGDERDSAARNLEERMCSKGDHIEVDNYSGVGPADLMGESASAQSSWIQARFAGRAVPNNCPR